MIGLSGQDLASLATAGLPVPAPLLVQSVIDPETNVTCVAQRVIHHFGFP